MIRVKSDFPEIFAPCVLTASTCENEQTIQKVCIVKYTEPRKGHFLSDIYQKRN